MHDYVILGGGSSGCALAARLSEDPRKTVLLVEAGKDITAETAPADVLASYPGRAYFNPAFTWPGLDVMLGGAATNDPDKRKRARYEQARILGGGSSINGLIAVRGAPTDYDGWEDMGATGWNFASVLPYFRKLERDLDFADEYHGRDGPITIRRYPAKDWTGFVGAVAKALNQRGLPTVPDQNGAWQDGVMPLPTSIDENDRRVSCAYAYLTPAVRRRPNLTIRTETFVRRILFDGTRATGAEIAADGKTETVRGHEIILTCGTIHSPAVLMRSGVGAPDELAQHGIAVTAALPGVGRNLLEHPSVSISCYLARHGRLADQGRHHTQVQARFSSGMAGIPAGDMCIALLARSGWHAMGRRVGSLYFFVNKSYSQGVVTLRSADPADEPLVDFRMLSDRRDLERMRNAFRFVAQIATAPELDGVRSHIFPTQYSDRVRRVSSSGPAQRHPDEPVRWAARRGAGAARLADRYDGHGWHHTRRRDERRRDARCLSRDSRDRRVASGRHMPHGARRRSARRDDALRACARRGQSAHLRCFGDAVDPLRQYQYFHHHGGGAHGGFDQGRGGSLGNASVAMVVYEPSPLVGEGIVRGSTCSVG